MSLSKNIVGWILLLIGVVLISWVLYYTYNIFTGKVEVPEIFNGENSHILPEKPVTQITDIQAQIEKIMEEQLRGLLPSDGLLKFFNLGAWLILASIFIFGGAQISGIGIKLLSKA